MTNPFAAAVREGLGGIGSVFEGIQQRREKNTIQGLLESASQGDEQALLELTELSPQSAQNVMALGQRRAAQEEKEEKEKAIKFGNLAIQAKQLKTPREIRGFIQNVIEQENDQEIIDELTDTMNMDDDQLLFDLDRTVALAQSSFGELIKPPEAKPFEQARGKGMQGYSFNPNTNEYFVDESMRARIEKTQADLADKERLTIKDVSSINKDLTVLTKGAREIKAAASSLEGLKETSTPAAKLAAVFKFMKALDPTSVVRETEQGQVYESQGVPQALLGRINNLTGEGRLTGPAFQDLVSTAKNMANSAITSSRDEAISYLDVFGELDEDRRGRLERRVPALFDLQESADTPTVKGKTTKGRGRNKTTVDKQSRLEELRRKHLQ